MKRRNFITQTVALGIIAAVARPLGAIAQSKPAEKGADPLASGKKLAPPEKGSIPVAFAVSQGVTVIDFAGPWEVFQDVDLKKDRMAFQLYTVSDDTDPIRGSAGLKIVPDYSFENAPAPKIVVVPAQSGSPKLHEWLRKVTANTDITMSVCTGAFQLAKAGLLAGKSATTHHLFTDELAKTYPDIDVKRGLRFVEGDKISTAGGLTSGIDLALRVVERYFGREVAQATADYMEYQSKSWIV